MNEREMLIEINRNSSAVHSEPELPEIPAQWEELATAQTTRKYKAVLFDVYGTLFSSAAGDIGISSLNQTENNKAWENIKLPLNMAELRSFFLQKVKETHEKMKDRTQWPEVQADKIWEQFIKQHNANSGEELNISAREFALCYELAVNPAFPMPGALQTIIGLREQGCILGIISNAQFYTPYLFEAFFGSTSEKLGFRKKLTIYSYKYREAKPSPLLFETAAWRLIEQGIEPKDCAFVGNDMLSDIYGAQKAGFQGILFAGDKRSLRLRETDERVSGLKPSRIIRCLQELVVRD